jgi:D-sedoheptulose 7-phosphate isomerase
MANPDKRISFCKQYFSTLADVMHHLPWHDIDAALACLECAYREGRHVFVIGNGGSAATASHTANDLLKVGSKAGKRGFGAFALADNVPTITAIANDEHYSDVFSRQLELLAHAGDVLIVFSASGNSPNILKALGVAREREMKVVSFLGMGGGKAAPLSDVAVVVPSNDYGPVEDAHMALDHLIASWLAEWISRGGGGGEQGE